jgi:plastocyanin
MRTVRSLVILSVVALGGVACRSETPRQSTADTTAAKAAAGPTGPQRYTVVVDGPSTLGAENLVYGAYFPKTVSVRPGDTVVFDNRSSNDIHTITLGVKSDRSDQPLTVLKSGQANPVVFGPCFTSEAARPDLAACPGQQPGAAAAAPAPPPFTGKGYWNSGAILFASAPPAAGSKTATVELAADIAPGAYTVTCLLHPFMESSLQVVAPDGARLSPAEVAAAADKELGVAKADATGVAVPAQVPVGNGATVAAGWGDKLVAVNRYSPETVSIKVGQTVTWRTVSPYMPHTVSFQPPFQSPDQPNALLPTGVKSGARFGGGVSHSGIFGPPPEFPDDTFSLTFTKPGTYSYLCVLHPGMAGTVQVS